MSQMHLYNVKPMFQEVVNDRKSSQHIKVPINKSKNQELKEKETSKCNSNVISIKSKKSLEIKRKPKEENHQLL